MKEDLSWSRKTFKLTTESLIAATKTAFSNAHTEIHRNTLLWEKCIDIDATNTPHYKTAVALLLMSTGCMHVFMRMCISHIR